MNAIATPASRPQTVLIVDGTPASLAVLAGHLEARGVRVLVAQDGDEGLRRAELDRPDLILFDAMLPQADGFAVCGRLKASDATREIPVIFMSAPADAGDKVAALEAAGVDCITRPFQMTEVIARVNAQLEQCAMRRQLAEQKPQLRREVAAREQAEAALRGARDELEERLKQCTAELELANVRLQAEVAERARAEEALRRTQRELRLIMDSVPVMIAHFDTEPRYLFANRAYAEFFGLNPAAIVGCRVWEVIGEELYASLRLNLERVLRGEPVQYERRRIERDGTQSARAVSLVPELDSAGAVIGCYALHVNISERRWAEDALRRSEERFFKAFDANPLPMVISRDRCVIEVNKSFLNVSGYAKEEIVGRELDEIELFVNRGDTQRIGRMLRERGSVRDLELEVRTKTGEVRAVLYSADVIELGGQQCLLAAAVDLTERKRAERALAASEERFRRLTELSSDWYWEQDEELRFSRFEGNVPSDFPAQPTRSLGKRRWELGAQVVSGQTWQEHRLQLEARRPFRDLEYVFLGAHGELIAAARTSGEPVFDAEGRFKGYRGVARDITERKKQEQRLKRVEDALSESERTLATLISNLPGVVYRCRNDKDWTMDFLSEGVFTLTGHRAAEFVAQSVAYGDLIHLEDQATVWNDVQAALGERRPFQLNYRIRTASGEQKWVWEQGRGVFSSTGELLFLEGFITDDTERKRAEQALAEAKERLEFALEGSSAAVWEADGEELHLSRGWAAMLGDAPGETRTTLGALKALVHPDDLPRVRADLARTLKGLRDDYSVEHRVRARDGTWRWIVSRGRVVGRTGEGQALRMRGINIDVTELRRAQEALRESEERFRSLYHDTPSMYFTVDQAGTVLSVNEFGASYLGYAPEELIGRSVLGVFHGSDRAAALEHVAQCLDSPGRLFAWELRKTRKDGTLLRVRETARAVRDSRGAPVALIVCEDITDSRRADALLRLEHRVALALANAESSSAALIATLRAICESEGWECGRYFRVDNRAGVLRLDQTWSVPDEAIRQFLLESLAIALPAGEGLAGRAWASGEAVWSEDISTEPGVRLPSHPGGGMRGSFVFPLAAEGKVLGVMVFSTRELRQPDERLLQAAQVIGGQIGQFLRRKREEEALAESEARFRSFTALSSDWYWEQDAELRFTALSAGFQANYPNVVVADYLGKRLWEIEAFAPLDGDWEKHTTDLAAHRPFRDLLLKRIDPNGALHYLSASGEPLFDREDRFIGYRGTGRDVSAEKRAEEALRASELRYRSLVEISPDAVFLERDGIIEYANRAAGVLLRAARAEDLVGRPFSEFVHPEDEARAALRRAIANRAVQVLPPEERRMLRRDGSEFYAEIQAASFEYGPGLVVQVIVRDVSARREAERALREHAEQLRIAQGMARMISMQWEVQADRLDWSGSPEWLLGPRPASGVYPPFKEMVHAEDRAAFVASREAALRGEREHQLDYRIVRTDGAIRWVSARGAMFRDDAGRAARMIVVIQDITERKLAEEALRASEARYRSLVELSPDAIVLGRRGMIDYANPAAAALLGFERAEELLNRPFLDFVHPDYRAHSQERSDLLNRRATVVPVSERRMLRRDGSSFDAEVAACSFASGEGLMVQAIVRDITERKRAEQELRELNAELEHRVAERTADLTSANRELESFSYSVSHDLRAPLRAINGFARLLEEEWKEGLSDEGRRLLARIAANAENMGKLIDGLLGFARLSRQALVKTRVEPGALVREALEEAAPQIAGRDLEIRVGELPPCQADRLLLKQVFANLVSNAMKYTSKRGGARIDIGAAPAAGSWVYYVRDNGAGFDMRYAGKLFGVFQRLHSASEFEGTGVGLATVQRIVQRHGGHIWAEAAPNEGATFLFTIPGTGDPGAGA